MNLYTEKTTDGEDIIIPKIEGKQIQIYGIRITATENVANTATLKNEAETIDKYVFTATGQVEGFLTENRPGYVVNELRIECSTSSTLAIAINYEQF